MKRCLRGVCVGCAMAMLGGCAVAVPLGERGKYGRLEVRYCPPTEVRGRAMPWGDNPDLPLARGWKK